MNDKNLLGIPDSVTVRIETLSILRLAGATIIVSLIIIIANRIANN